MANRLAEDALAGREQASYRDYLNAMANTNIRSREQEAMDRYRQGELGIRGEDVSGLNQFRTGQIGIGRTDAATRAAAAGSQAAYQQGLVDAAKLQAVNQLTLGKDYNQVLRDQIQANKELAQQMALRQSPELQVFRADQLAKNEEAYRNALMNRYNAIKDRYESDWGWDVIGSDMGYDPSTVGIRKIMRANPTLSVEQAARQYAEEELGPFYGKQRAQSPLSINPEVLGKGSNNPPASVLSPAINAAIGTNLVSAPQPNQQMTNRSGLGSFFIQQPR